MLIGSLVGCMLDCIHVCVFHFSKNCFEKLVRHLLDSQLSSSLSFFILLSRQLLDTWWIDRESSCLLDSFSTVGGQIELLFLHLMDCSSTPPRYLYLSTTISSIPTSIASLIPLDTCIYRDLLRTYIFILRDLVLISSISLDLSAPIHLPNTISLTPNLFLCDFSSFFKIFFSW